MTKWQSWEKQKPQLVKILNQYWQFPDYRPAQTQIVRTLLSQQHSLCLLATGGGKSLCFQSVGLYLAGLTLVISPLLSLMQDQVQRLILTGLRAAMFTSLVSPSDKQKILVQIAANQLDFLYLAPESLKNSLLLSALADARLKFVVIDEAHCISIWGNDFRPAYQDIGQFLKKIPQLSEIKIAAFTATATKAVRRDICRALNFSPRRIISFSSYRANLNLRVLENLQPQALVELVKSRQQAGAVIIYAETRTRTEEVASFLQTEGIIAACYHAGLSDQLRQQRQADFLVDKIPVLVATNAFGMGVDKPNIRTVIHLQISDSLENYFQEIGRAGRDGSASSIILVRSWRGLNFRQKLIANRFLTELEYQQFYQLLRIYTRDQKKLTLKITDLLEQLASFNISKIWTALATFHETRVIFIANFNQLLKQRPPVIKIEIRDRTVIRLGHRLKIPAKTAQLRVAENKLLKMWKYSLTTECRMQFMLKYFSEKIKPCGNCDICLPANSCYDLVCKQQSAK